MTTNLLALQSLSPGRDLNAYVQTVSGFPILSVEEEKALAERFYYENDLEAARKLVLCHLRLQEQRHFVGYAAKYKRTSSSSCRKWFPDGEKQIVGVPGEFRFQR